MLSPIPKPKWSVHGVVLDWPDRELSLLRQSPWTAIESGWASLVHVPRNHAEDVRLHTLFLVVITDDVAPDIACRHAENLIRLRLRAAGSDPPLHLGEVTI